MATATSEVTVTVPREVRDETMLHALTADAIEELMQCADAMRELNEVPIDSHQPFELADIRGHIRFARQSLDAVEALLGDRGMKEVV